MVAERGQPVRAVRPGVFVIADPDERLLEKTNDGGQHPPPGERGGFQVLRRASPDPGQRQAEFEEAFVLRLVARRAPGPVIAILLPSPGVPAGRLDVPARVGADPDVGPGRRNREGLDAVQRAGIADPPARTLDVDEPSSDPPPTDAGGRVGDVPEHGRARVNGAGNSADGYLPPELPAPSVFCRRCASCRWCCSVETVVCANDFTSDATLLLASFWNRLTAF